MISQDRDSRDIEMFRVPPICLDDIPEILLCKFYVWKGTMLDKLAMLLSKNVYKVISQKLAEYLPGTYNKKCSQKVIISSLHQKYKIYSTFTVFVNKIIF